MPSSKYMFASCAAQPPTLEESFKRLHIGSMTNARPKPQLLSLTEAAARQVKAIMAERGKGFLRAGVSQGGCAGMEYVMEYADAPKPLDEVVTDKGVTILIDAASVLFLLGAQIDYESTPLHSKFLFRNPNETDACGCGISVTIEPAQAV